MRWSCHGDVAVWTATLSCLAGLLAGCAAGEATTIDIEVTLPEPEKAERVEVFLVQSCSPEAIEPGNKPAEWISSAYTLRDGTLEGLGGGFAPGTYGLYAVAQDGDCAVVAQRCIELELDGEPREPVVIELASSSGQGCGEDLLCDLFDGSCKEPERVADCSTAADGTLCFVDGNINGRCYEGSCCTGCWNGSFCESGELQRRCGIAGAGCQDCAAECDSDLCIEGECAPRLAYSSVSAGEEHNCAITDTDELYCWGASRNGELGIGDVQMESCGSIKLCMTQPTLLDFEVQGEPSRWSKVSAGHDASCGIMSDASLWCWGSNDSGRMGATADIDSSMEPYRVSDASFLYVDLEKSSGCAIGSDDSLSCWGENADGQANPFSPGGSKYEPSMLPMTETWLDVALGSQHVCATDTSGTIWCWGSNWDGQLGIGETSSSIELPQPIVESASSVAAFNNSSCANTQDDGLLCWGQNHQGQLGTGDESGADVPSPTAVAGGHAFAQISGGGAFACGVTMTGALYCWGQNNDGQLGIGEAANLGRVYVPARVGSRNDWLSVSAGDRHACAVRENGTLWCWGRNSQGQLGLGHRDDRASPSRVCLSQTVTGAEDAADPSGPSSLK